MKSLINVVTALLLLAAVIGAVSFFVGAFHTAAFGEEVTLFASPEAGVSLFETPETVSLFEQAATQELPEEIVVLFEGPTLPAKTEHDDFSRNQPPADALAAIEAAKSIDRRPYVACYGPLYEGVDLRPLGQGDARIRVKCHQEHEDAYPAYIREYAKVHGWPVQNWESPSGRGAIAAGNRSLDELVELVKMEPALPVRTVSSTK